MSEDSKPHSERPASMTRMVGHYEARITELEEQLEALRAEAREINAILDVGNDYDSTLLQDVFDWWQKPSGVREMLDAGFRERQERLLASNPASEPEAS